MLSGPIKGQKVQLGGREGGKEGGDGQIKARSTEITLASDNSRTTSETEVVAAAAAAAYPATSISPFLPSLLRLQT